MVLAAAPVELLTLGELLPLVKLPVQVTTPDTIPAVQLFGVICATAAGGWDNPQANNNPNTTRKGSRRATSPRCKGSNERGMTTLDLRWARPDRTYSATT